MAKEIKFNMKPRPPKKGVDELADAVKIRLVLKGAM